MHKSIPIGKKNWFRSIIRYARGLLATQTNMGSDWFRRDLGAMLWGSGVMSFNNEMLEPVALLVTLTLYFN